MHVNYRFMLDFASRCKGPILDYGCGSGEVVKAGLSQGLDVYGCETFYGGAHGQQNSVGELLGTRVIKMRAGLIPFPDGRFSCVVNNQVFEHVEDIDLALSEIRRVLAPGGSLLCMFPSREVWRENHCGVPFTHRFNGLRYHWLLTFRCLGFGYFTAGKTRRYWAQNFAEWIGQYCYYRPLSEIEAKFEHHGFFIKYAEKEYLRFRGVIMPRWLFRKLGFLVIVANRE